MTSGESISIEELIKVYECDKEAFNQKLCEPPYNSKLLIYETIGKLINEITTNKKMIDDIKEDVAYYSEQLDKINASISNNI